MTEHNQTFTSNSKEAELHSHRDNQEAHPQVSQPHWFFKYLPLILLVIFAIVIYSLLSTKQDAKRRKPPIANTINVETLLLKPRDIPVSISSFGLVAPRIESRIVAQVAGKITYVSDKLRDGGFFRKDETLAQIEKTDYQAEVNIQLANVAASEQTYLEEKAQAEQAKEDWKRISNGGTPSDLTLRLPQLKAAQTSVTSAKAQLTQAQLNLQRSTIKAPFDGRVRSKNIDIGQVVATNTTLADIYATDAIEVSLPIKNSDLKLLELPNKNISNQTRPTEIKSVTIKSTLIDEEIWEGHIVRVAGAIDDASRQLNITAQIDKPYSDQYAHKTPLKIGEYVTASISGKTLKSVISIPNKAIYQGSYVYVYRDGQAFRQDIGVFWQNETEVIIDAGLNPGDELIITPLGQISSGTAVSKNATPRTPASRKSPQSKKNKSQKNPQNIQDNSKSHVQRPKNKQ